MTSDSAHEPVRCRIGRGDLPVVSAHTVVVGTGAAGYCAAVRLADGGQRDVVMVTDKVLAGTSRNAGSDKQTYYKLTLAGQVADSVAELARTLFDGGAMDGDNALVEAAYSARCFLNLVESGVPFPQNRYGEFVGYKTDHDPRARATSAGPYTSRAMVERLEARAQANGTRVFEGCRVVDVITAPAPDGGRRVAGLLVVRTDGTEASPWLLFRCANLVYATGGPAGIYATRVFPAGQWGASGAAFRAGVWGRNLTEWQFGLASLQPRWNVSGSYMQVVPRLVSTAADGSEEREFLPEVITDYGRMATLTFLKGYQWPFDVRKARDGSSLIDLLTYRETVLRGRRAFLDFRANPLRPDFDAAAMSSQARDYLARADALGGTPVQRLRRLNEPAYQFYRERGLDLSSAMLEVDVCAQHSSGGLVVDSWWRSNLAGFYPVGEAAGSHGVYRPGGAALNSGQVGATRAAAHILAGGGEIPAVGAFAAAAAPVLEGAAALLGAAATRAGAGATDNTAELLARVQRLMSAKAGPVRSPAAVAEALETTRAWLAGYAATVVADASPASASRVFLVRDVLTTAYVHLSAMADYLAHGGRSRGSVLYTDPDGVLPLAGDAAPAQPGAGLPAAFRFVSDDGALDQEIQEVGWAPDGGAGQVRCHWRRRRGIPADDDFFENVWREYRERGAVPVNG